MVSSFLVVGLLILASILAWLLLIYVENLLSPRTKPVGMGKSPIESGERSLTASRFVGFQYYQYAIVFVVVEALFLLLFLWGQNARVLGSGPFIGISIGLVYLIILVRYLIRQDKPIKT